VDESATGSLNVFPAPAWQMRGPVLFRRVPVGASGGLARIARSSSDTLEGFMLTIPALHSRALAEFVGTATLITIGCGSILMAGSGDVGSGLVGVALAHGLAIAVMVTAIGHVSGGHLNPAVTFGALVTKNIEPLNAVVYWVAQLLGGVAGAALVKVGFSDQIASSSHLKGTVPALGLGTSTGQGILLEAIATFFLVWVVFGVAIDRDGAWFKVAGLPIGFVIVMDILMIGPATGGAMNPARWFGPALVFNRWDDALVWIVGPLVGAAVAALAYVWGVRPRLTDEAAA
jgi:aquaporin Z